MFPAAVAGVIASEAAELDVADAGLTGRGVKRRRLRYGKACVLVG